MTPEVMETRKHLSFLRLHDAARAAVFLVGMTAAGSVCWAATPTKLPSLEDIRSTYLDGLILPQRYIPGKNSFIVQDLTRGRKVTLLNLAGSGSVRHMWCTWAAKDEKVAVWQREERSMDGWLRWAQED